MGQLIVRDIEDRVVRKLKERAGRHGISTEEEHRRILRGALLGQEKKKSFEDALREMPNVGTDEDFLRPRALGRKIEL